MTDEQIIKALECCSNSCDNGYAECDKCPRFREESGCTLRTMKDALNLINRQQAELERLQKMQQLLAKELDAEKIKNF